MRNRSSNYTPSENNKMYKVSDSLSTPLLPDDRGIARPINFYQPDQTLDIPRSSAEGFLILLSGGEYKKGMVVEKDLSLRQNDDVDLTLAFAAITDGNVVDACFGDNPLGGIKFGGSTFAVKAATDVKSIIRDAAGEASPSLMIQIQKVTINAYMRCFEIVIRYHDKLADQSLLSRCFKSKQIRRNAQNELQECFRDLVSLFATF